MRLGRFARTKILATEVESEFFAPEKAKACRLALRTQCQGISYYDGLEAGRECLENTLFTGAIHAKAHRKRSARRQKKND